MDFYFDRNKNDSIIKETLTAIVYYLTKDKNNTINQWNVLNKKNILCIQWGIPSKKDTMFRKTLLETYKSCLIIEQGFINRKSYRAITYNNLAGMSEKKPENCTGDRFSGHQIVVKPLSVDNSGYILVCGQLPWDAQVRNIKNGYIAWLHNIFDELHKITNKLIIYREHPAIGNKKFKIPNYIQKDQNIDLTTSLNRAYCVVSYNSTSLVEAIMCGKPIIAFDKMSVVYDVASGHNVSDVNNLVIPEHNIVMQQLYNISYMQWNIEEIKNGDPFEHWKKI